MSLKVPDDTESAPSLPLTLLHIVVAPEQAYFFFRGQLSFMMARGMSMHVASPPGPLLDQLPAEDPATIHPVRIERRIRPLRDLLTVVALLHLIRRVEPDIVQAHSPKGGIIGMLAAWLARTPHRIYHIHGLPAATTAGAKGLLLRSVARVTCALATEVWSVGPSVMRQAVDAGLVPAGKIRVIGAGSINGIDTVRFDPARVTSEHRAGLRASLSIPHDATVIGFVGRVIREKGIAELLHAFERLGTAHPALHLLLIGPAEAHDPLPADVRPLLDHARVHAIGAQYDTPPWYACMDIFCLPSYREGLPITLLEASSMGLPSVATDIPGPADLIIDGETGLLIPLYEVDALAAALEALIADKALRQSMGAAAHRHITTRYAAPLVHHATFEAYRALGAAFIVPG